MTEDFNIGKKGLLFIFIQLNIPTFLKNVCYSFILHCLCLFINLHHIVLQWFKRFNLNFETRILVLADETIQRSNFLISLSNIDILKFYVSFEGGTTNFNIQCHRGAINVFKTHCISIIAAFNLNLKLFGIRSILNVNKLKDQVKPAKRAGLIRVQSKVKCLGKSLI